MRKLLLSIHIYCGLLCAPYLLIFGISSLLFNHPVSAWEKGGRGRWEETAFDFQILEDDAAMAAAIRDSLGLMGWYLPWDTRRDSLEMQFKLSHFGKDYLVKAGLASGHIAVWKAPKGISNILIGLHFLGESIPSAPWWINTWQYYQDLSVYCLLFWVITGLYLWLRGRRGRTIAAVLFCTFTIASTALILYVWLDG